MKIRLLVLLPLCLLSSLCFGSTPEIKDLHRLLSQLPIDVDRIPVEPPGIEEAKELVTTSSKALKSGEITLDQYQARILTLAEAGNPIAKFLYGVNTLERGDSTDSIQDMLTESVQQGCMASATVKGLYYLATQDTEKGLPWLQLAAVKGDTSAQVYLANLYAIDNAILDANKPLAYAWMKIAQRQIDQVPTNVNTIGSLLSLTMQVEFSQKNKEQGNKIFDALKDDVNVASQHVCSHAHPYRAPQSGPSGPSSARNESDVIREQMGEAPYSEAKLMSLLKQGKSVFVYFTADWCVSCKANEKTALCTKQTQEFFKEKEIVLLVGDYTEPDESIDEVLKLYNQPGVPLYLYFRPGDKLSGGQRLPQLLATPDTIIDSILEQPEGK